MEFIARFICGLILNYPGALIRWLFFKKDKSYSYYLEEIAINNFVSMVFLTIILILYNIFFK